MQIVFPVFAFIIGTCLGSFLCCQARRAHLKDITAKSTTAKSAATKRAKKSTSSRSALGSRSVCLHCGCRLKWHDNIPIFSWLFLKGKCRKCGQKIGLAELLAELGGGFTFLILCLGARITTSSPQSLLPQTPLALVTTALLLIFMLALLYLAIYDGLYGQLPVPVLTLSIICAIIIATLQAWAKFSDLPALGAHLANIFFAVLILGGLYLFLYLISKGKWVGDGDWLLGVALALVLGNPWLALLVLFLSNLLATIVMLPVVRRQKSRKIYFGPFLVAAFVVVFAFSDFFYAIINLW